MKALIAAVKEVIEQKERNLFYQKENKQREKDLRKKERKQIRKLKKDLKELESK